MRDRTTKDEISDRPATTRGRHASFVRHGAVDRRPLALIGLGVVVAVLIVVVVWRLDQRPETSNLKRMVDLDRIAVPSTPTEDEFARPAAELDRDVMASLRDGASVQVAGEDGALAQEYGAVRIDPLPDAWVEMQRPWARLHPRNGRIVEMRAIAGTMRVPNQAIESGRLEGDVEIRIYEPPVDGGDAALEGRAPAVTIEAETAIYDAAAGEIHSPRAVRVTTSEATFAGEDLRILFAGDGTRISKLTVERATEPILIRPSRPTPAAAASSRPSDSRTTDTVASATDTRAVAAGGADDSDATMASAADAWSARDANAGDAPSPRASNSPPASPVNPAIADPDAWYRLVLEDEVVVERVVRDARGTTMRSTVSGDRLVATFALGESGIEGSPIAAAPVRGAGMAPTPSNLVAAAAVAFGPVAPILDEEVVRVHYTGRLVMIPDPAAAERMTGDGDSEIVIESNDGRGIDLSDDGNEAVGSCARLEYRSASERIELVGDEANPLVIESPRFSLAGGRFWMVRSEGIGGLIGPGRMRFAPETATQVRTAFGTAADRFVHGLQTMLAAGPGADRVVAWAAIAAIEQESTPANADTPPRLEIEWEGGVDLDFDDLDDDGRLQQARFEGDVRVASDDFKLGSQALVVDFADGGEVDAIERILATGGARVDRVGEIGSLEAASIDLVLDRTEDGRTVPTEMIAEGAVEASDPGQTMWTDRLVVRFRPRAEEDAGAAAGAIEGAGFGGDEMGAVEITRVDAVDGVQVRLEEGARVFADRLEGDGVARTLQLTGDDVMVLRSNVVADRLRDVRFDDATRNVRGTGPGRFRYYDADVVPASRDRIERPTPSSRTSLAATWTQAMRYDERANGGAGRLDLEGDVRVRSTPDAMTSDRLDAREVSLDLANRVGGVRPAGERAEGLLADEGGKDLKRLVARGDAVMESRTWKTAARRGDPRLFRVEGAHVEYLVASREALVDGAGGLLVHDPESSTAPEDRGPASTAGFGIDGTSRFRWARRMTMNREVDDRYLVVMEREVEVLHAGLQPDDTLSLTADRLEVTIERPDEAAAVAADGKTTPQDAGKDAGRNPLESSGVELGGPADLVRVRGIGRVFVRTPEHDVECSEFDYNVDTQIAMLRADPGRVVTVQSKGAATPIRAERVQWDLRTGRIRILGGEGAISR